ncbi:MAG: hypothetical protein U0744_08215 [Gemmataceae bacterium]
MSLTPPLSSAEREDYPPNADPNPRQAMDAAIDIRRTPWTYFIDFMTRFPRR